MVSGQPRDRSSSDVQSSSQAADQNIRGPWEQGHPLTRLLVQPKAIRTTAQELQGRGFRLMWIDNYSFVVTATPANFDLADYDLVESEEEINAVNMQ